MTATVHNLREVSPVLSEDGQRIVGYVGTCLCGWPTPVLPKDDAWSALADHVVPSLLAKIPPPLLGWQEGKVAP